jgi:hypothetical protein
MKEDLGFFCFLNGHISNLLSTFASLWDEADAAQENPKEFWFEYL